MITREMPPKPGSPVFGLSIVVARERTVLVADTAINIHPTAAEIADIAVQAADQARRLGHEPRVALLSFSNFGNPMAENAAPVRDAVALLDQRDLDFEYDGEMAADVALNPEMMALYPFCRLSEPANVLIMPTLHSAHIATKMVQGLGSGTVIGPILIGLTKSVQIAPMGATVSDLVNVAALAAHDADR